MEYRKLGPSGTIVSVHCLGAMTFGAEADEATSFGLIDDFFAAGGNFVDTADVYSAGVSEEIVGRWLKARPTEARQAVIATKGRFPMGAGPNDVGLSRRHLGDALDASLRRLGVERVDLYQMHAWDALTPIEETLEALHDVVKAGQVVRVKVLEVDLPRQRIALTMRLTDEVAPKRERHDAPTASRGQQRQPAFNKPQRQSAPPPNNAMAAAFAKLKK